MDIFYIYFLYKFLNNSCSGLNLTNTTQTWTLKPGPRFSATMGERVTREKKYGSYLGKGGSGHTPWDCKLVVYV